MTSTVVLRIASVSALSTDMRTPVLVCGRKPDVAGGVAPALPFYHPPRPRVAALAMTRIPQCPGSQARDGGDHLAADDLQRGHVPDVRHRADRSLEPHLREPAQLVDDLAGLLALLPDVEDEVAGLDDVVVVAALGLAVGAQDVELAGDFGGDEQVAGLRVAGHQPQRLALTRPPDHDRRVRGG